MRTVLGRRGVAMSDGKCCCLVAVSPELRIVSRSTTAKCEAPVVADLGNRRLHGNVQPLCECLVAA